MSPETAGIIVLAIVCFIAGYVARMGQMEVEDSVNDLLLSDDSECDHPSDKVVNFTTFGSDTKFGCTACGAESATPFPS
jgi:hypothetical protein